MRARTNSNANIGAILLVGLMVVQIAPFDVGASETERHSYVAQEHKTLQDFLNNSAPEPKPNGPDWLSTIALTCPARPVRQSSLQPELNVYPIKGLDDVQLLVSLEDHTFTNPIFLACFYQGNDLSSPSNCFDQGQCIWTGGRADHVEIWVPAATLYRGSPVTATVGDVYFTIL